MLFYAQPTRPGAWQRCRQVIKRNKTSNKISLLWISSAEVHKTNPNMYNLNASEIMFAQRRRRERRTELLFQLCLRLQTFISFFVSPGLERERSDEAVPLSNIRCIIHFNSENKYLPFLTSGGERKWERLPSVVWKAGEIFTNTQEQPMMFPLPKGYYARRREKYPLALGSLLPVSLPSSTTLESRTLIMTWCDGNWIWTAMIFN